MTESPNLPYKVLVTAFADDVPSDMSEDGWISAYYAGTVAEGVTCMNTLENLQPISVDGHAGKIGINDACSDAQAFVFIDERVHVFAVWRGNQEALLESFLSTVDFE